MSLLHKPPFTIGVEEEYLLVNRKTRDLAVNPPVELMEACNKRCKDQVSPEFLRAQIEIGTKVCKSIAEVFKDLSHLRNTIADVSDQYGLAPIAASTHPFAHWAKQKRTEKERYSTIDKELQTPVRRLLACGMHVHIGIDDDELRIDLMNQVAYFLPHLLALSSSSPFWKGKDTGLKSYRLNVFDGLPRTGLPERFSSFSEYERHVAVLVNAGLIEDATKIWWDLRPSARYPTLEVRVMDVCTRLEDAVSLAALLTSLFHFLYRLRCINQRWRHYSPMFIKENRWRAIRYGFDAGMLDLARGQVTPFPDLLEELLDLVSEDAELLGCSKEVKNISNILTRGTSAHRQVNVYNEALANESSEEEALFEVVDFLVDETVIHRKSNKRPAATRSRNSKKVVANNTADAR